jgi:Ras GTPase-activating-like protein IQGAP2/3
MTETAIGNLVGKLEFTEDEIQNTQRGLDMAGVTLPSFRGMDKHFGDQPAEPEEPEESEEDRIERELHENEYHIEQLQRIARGALVRLGLARKMQVLWDEEPAITELQAAIRGMFARTSYAYRSDMYNWSRDVSGSAEVRIELCED